MRVGNFSVLIPEGRECETGHVSIDHGRQYTLRMGNHAHVRCDADVTVDGKEVGGFRIEAGCTLTLERPAHDTGRFTFFKADSTEAQQAAVATISSQDRGLIQVRFKPERKPTVHSAARSGFYGAVKTSGGLRALKTACCRPQNASAGITGLTGQSNQSFQSVTALDYDPAGETTITLRLVADAFAPRELTPASRANPVPAAVE